MEPWQQVGAYIAAWRRMRGYRTQTDLAKAANVSPRTIGSLERGEQGFYRDDTLVLVERALGWEIGSIQSILRGGEPVPVGRPLHKDLVALINAWDQLPENTQRIIRLIAEEEQRPGEGPQPSDDA